MIKTCIILLLYMLSHNIVFGQLFFEVDSIQDAELKVFYVEDEANCDIKVCFVYTEEEAQLEAHWCEIAEPEKADIKIIFVDDPALADLNLCMAFDCAEAKWLKEEKKRKLHK